MNLAKVNKIIKYLRRSKISEGVNGVKLNIAQLWIDVYASR